VIIYYDDVGIGAQFRCSRTQGAIAFSNILAVGNFLSLNFFSKIKMLIFFCFREFRDKIKNLSIHNVFSEVFSCLSENCITILNYAALRHCKIDTFALITFSSSYVYGGLCVGCITPVDQAATFVTAAYVPSGLHCHRRAAAYSRWLRRRRSLGRRRVVRRLEQVLATRTTRCTPDRSSCATSCRDRSNTAGWSLRRPSSRAWPSSSSSASSTATSESICSWRHLRRR